ncbi:MAG: DUF1028 domain-containing protein [Candidatus Bipolaricaulia bacterium]
MIQPSTFSIVGHDPKEGKLGVAVQSKFLAVGSVVPFARAKVGAVATQAAANTSYGPKGLEMLERGMEVGQVVKELTDEDPESEIRQMGIVDASGNSAAHTGEECFNYAGHITGENFSCQGNILVSSETVEALARSFRSTDDSLSYRLVEALKSAQRAGGDRRGKQSAAILVVKEEGGYGGFNDRYIDLRVDDHEEPIQELDRILDLHHLYFEEPTEEQLVPLDQSRVKKLQELLKKLDYYSGPVNGDYDEKTKQSFEDFCLTENFEEKLREDQKVDKRILEFIQKEKLS